MGFRLMHLHGRALVELVPQAVDRLEDYEWVDGELIAGLALGLELRRRPPAARAWPGTISRAGASVLRHRFIAPQGSCGHSATQTARSRDASRSAERGSTESGVDGNYPGDGVLRAVFEGEAPCGPPAWRACASSQPGLRARPGPTLEVRATAASEASPTRPVRAAGGWPSATMTSEIQSSRRVLLAE